MQDLFNHPITHVVFWTLVHSLWQGMIVAIIAAVVLYQTKKSNPGLRYNFFCGLMIVFVAANICTFFYEFSSSYQKFSGQTYEENTLHSSRIINIFSPENIEYRLIQSFQSIDYLIVSIYLLVVLLKCANIVIGFKRLSYLKSKHVFAANEFWNTRLNQLAQKIKISKQVHLLQSAIIQVPTTIGFFKPVILFPVCLLTELPVIEIEAILLHELAHIKRKDYLINIIQSFTGIIFFFNPAVLWLSSLIKNERENCCDDIAIHHTNNKKQFIHALVSFQDHQLSLNAPAFAGNKSQLFNRIKRIITNNNKTLNNMEKILLASGIIVTGLIAATVPQNLQPHVIKQNQTIKAIINRDTVPQTKQDTLKDSVTYNMFLKEQEQAAKAQTDAITKQTKMMQAQAAELAIESQKMIKNNQVKIQKDAIKAQNDAMAKQGKEIQAQAKALAKQAEAMKQINQENFKEINSKEMKDLIDKATALSNSDAMKRLKDLSNNQQFQNLVNSEQLKSLAEQSEALSKNKELLELQQSIKEDALKLQQDALKDKMDKLKQNQDMLLTPQGKLEKQEMMNQIEDLKKKQQQLLNQNKALKDSLNQLKNTKPSSIRPAKSTIAT